MKNDRPPRLSPNSHFISRITMPNRILRPEAGLLNTLRSATTPAKFKNCVSKTDGSGGGAAFSGLKPGDQLDTKFVVDGVASGALGSGKAQKFSLQVIAKYYSAGGSHKSVEEGTGDQKVSRK